MSVKFIFRSDSKTVRGLLGHRSSFEKNLNFENKILNLMPDCFTDKHRSTETLTMELSCFALSCFALMLDFAQKPLSVSLGNQFFLFSFFFSPKLLPSLRRTQVGLGCVT